MVPIVIHSKREFDEDTFRDHLFDLCNKHRKQQRALAFAFIVYDFDDHALNQILKNKDYWSSLDKISGRYISIFYVNSQNHYYNNRQKQIYREEVRQREKNLNAGISSYLVPLTPRPTPLDNAINFVRKEFKLDNHLKHPFVIFFQTDGEQILDCFFVTLKKERLEDAFLELRSHIKNAVDALAKVLPENYENHQEMFNLIRDGVESGQFYDFVNKQIISKVGIGTIVSFIKKIAGN